MAFLNPFSAALWAGGRNIGNPQISPDGSQVTFISSYPHGSELVWLELAGGPEIWLPLDPKVARSHTWLPDGSGLIYVGKDSRIHQFDFATSSCRSITKNEQDLSVLAVSPNGKSIAYVDDLHDVFVIDIANGVTTRLSSDADFVFDPTWSPDSQWVAWHEWDVPNMPWDGSRIVVRDAEARDAIRTVAGGENISVQQPRFSPDGSRLAFLCDQNGWLNVWAVNTDDFIDPYPLVTEPYEHGNPSWSPGQRSYDWLGDGVMLCRNEKGFGRLVTYNIENDTTSLSESHDHYSSICVRKDVAVAVRAGFDRLPELELIEANSVRTLAHGSFTGLEDAGVRPESVEWISEDNALVHGRLYQTSDEPSPMLLWLHGGPTDQSPATMYSRWSYFLQRGWSILVVDYRGTTGWGREYAQALRGNWGVIDVIDAVAGAKAAIERGWALADAVVPIGGSAGGFTALSLMTRYPEIWKAGVTMYPVADLESAASDSWRFEAHYTDALVGPLPESEKLYKERSPLENAEKIIAPLLILHGDADVVVPIRQSQAMVEKLEKAGRTVEFHIYEGEGHGWRKPATRADELERVERFLNHYVLGMEGEL